jgi:glycosyltransferase involved in cell wall biosynthesis
MRGLPPPTLARDLNNDSSRLPVRVGFVVVTFSFGGSETETIELVQGANPAILDFTGIAVARPLPLPDGEPPKNSGFPPILTFQNSYIDQNDPRVRFVRDFQEAVDWVAERSDIIITWGLPDAAAYLPRGRRPKLVVQSKDSGDWARGYLSRISLATPYRVANSSVAAAAFPAWMRDSVTVIHDGINPRRVTPRISRTEQRRLWGLEPGDKVVGYLGRMEQDKGVSKTVEGLALLPDEWKAVFVGVNPNGSYTEALARHCEGLIPGRYRLVDWSHDVGSALAALDVFCHPSEHEGFSNSLGEAWLAGVPTVYTERTGAVGDLGDLGTPVSPNALGTEVAEAILQALSDSATVRRAQAVMQEGYLIQNYVRRWTDYLWDIQRQPERARLLLLCPFEMIPELQTWFSAIHTRRGSLDLCCLAIVGNEGTWPSSEPSMYAKCNFPTFYVSTGNELEQLITYTRAQVVLTFPACVSDHLLPARSFPPILVATPGCGSDDHSWAPWLIHLSQTAC